MKISGMISGFKEKVRNRQEKRDAMIMSEMKRLKKERALLKEKSALMKDRMKTKQEVSKMKKEIRIAKVESNPLGSAFLAGARTLKENAKKNKGKSAPSFLPSGKDHPMFRK